MSVDWDALKDKGCSDSQAETRNKLYQELDRTQLSMIADPIRADAKKSMAVIKGYCMAHDLFVPARYSRELESQLKICSSPDFFMRWLPGGHVWAAIVRPIYHKKLVIEAVYALLQRNPADT